MPNTLIIRADASLAMGTGHVMRCLALAQAWRHTGGSCTFAMSDPPLAIRELLRAEGCDVLQFDSSAGSEEDARELANLCRFLEADFVVVDGYQFGARYQACIKEQNVTLLIVDDNGHAEAYSADLLLNQNAHASTDLYRNRAPYTQLLLGPAYAMLRHEFTGWKTWQRKVTPVGRNVLVTMGGSDPGNVTASVVRALRQLQLDGIFVKVLVGPSNPHRFSLSHELSDAKTQFEFVSSTTEMPELMAWADLAISAAGSTCWEMCFLGLPAIIIPIAENQRRSAERLDATGAATQISATEAASNVLTENVEKLLLSSVQREKMSNIGRTLVDGGGALRVVCAIREASVHAACHD